MITGIIAEYNIFHNGHKYLIDKVKRNSDAVVAVMSGSFVQRGDVAITDKWTRAEMALRGGADLVLELPVCCALNAAPNFAMGGVGTLNALGVVDNIAFGSEYGEIDALNRAAHALETETADTSNKIQKYMSDGMSYPAALSKAYNGTVEDGLLDKPNNILAIEYIRALIKSDSKIKPITFRRAEAEHDANTVSNGFASASKIRSMLLGSEDISRLVPYIPQDFTINRLSQLDSAITAKLRTASPASLRNISEMTEGLENRVINAAKENYGFNSIAEAVKSKRYTMSKIRRIILASLLDFTDDIYSPYPEYIRVLGMNKTGMDILKSAKGVCSVPIITKTADFKDKSRQFELDLRACDIASICSDNPQKRIGGMDLKRSPVIC